MLGMSHILVRAELYVAGKNRSELIWCYACGDALFLPYRLFRSPGYMVVVVSRVTRQDLMGVVPRAFPLSCDCVLLRNSSDYGSRKATHLSKTNLRVYRLSCGRCLQTRQFLHSYNNCGWYSVRLESINIVALTRLTDIGFSLALWWYTGGRYLIYRQFIWWHFILWLYCHLWGVMSVRPFFFVLFLLFIHSKT